MDKKENYLFSVVIPVYNAEKYLKETLDSVIAQDIGFQDKIQVILVNDGSKDESEKICLEYREKYPDNIVYVAQENAGVSAARNHGIEYIKGKYVSFLDSDDKWEPDAFRQVYRFFENSYEHIDLVACRMRFFEARTDFHPLDFRFDKKQSRIINILNEESSIQMHVTSCVIKGETVKKWRFNEAQSYGEDAVYINKIIMDRGRYGVVTTAVCDYRKRMDESSAVQGQHSKRKWYIETPDQFYGELIRFSQEKYGTVIRYLQNILIYDIQYRVSAGNNHTLNKEEFQHYKEEIKEYLQYVDDQCIVRGRCLGMDEKIRLLKFKNGSIDKDKVTLSDNMAMYEKYSLINMAERGSTLHVNFISVAQDELLIEGCLRNWIFECWPDLKLKYTSNEKEYYPVQFNAYDIGKKDTLEGTQWTYKFYRVRIPLTGKKQRVFPVLELPNGAECRMKMVFTKFMPIAYKNSGAVYFSDKYFVRQTNNWLEVSAPKNMLKTKFICELKATKYMLKNNGQHAIWPRWSAWFKRFLKKKQIWLISDRDYVANDNGEHLFRYMCKHRSEYPNIQFYFVIAGESPDYERLKQYGPVIDLHSKRYKKLFLLCDKIVSSSANEDVFDLFGEDKIFYKGVTQFKYIFLQHGIIKDDLSTWLNKVNKNISAFVTSARPEYDSIKNGRYLYDKEVKLTGLPRFDNLIEKNKEHDPEKILLIMPTWRRYISDSFDPVTSQSVYSRTFKGTDFYKFYNGLMNHERLLNVMRAHGYRGILGLHPIHSEQSVDFEKNDVFDIPEGHLDYQELFVKGSIMLTDFSSTFFDFCYLRKPVVYAQFDRKKFFHGQVYDPGYFDYKRDGFGPVCEDLESTVDALIAIIENDAKLAPEYQERIENFYAYDDQNNCKRVVEAIMETDD
ncbi:CDP-glycerol glycerophosphotransferase family protein [Blautia sp. MSJ-19]|uniref:CDP-glycerol glycerophosphotransferase family protein n=1 Tax=Blautia sp. MSJ-19 TaxID=2841517 RepID=UPI001C0EF47D|nr:CDP-glycerol glycerophosphotransferase family protein [Blautia sp. MSJ-19]MBU5481424.1 bifunctional glycosyltransferase family 2 protein/CDP-glycerol:glycerophosphate glycerophosphotransferase [Blautia sp. MSJ-19]